VDARTGALGFKYFKFLVNIKSLVRPLRAKKKMKELGVTATSGGRATPGSAIAPLLRNGYAALRIPNAEMRKKLKNPLSELALQSKGICFMFRLASVATKISSRELIMN
jgi:hypothetical protein